MVPTTPLSPSFRAFMTGLIDYAGMFPPASLDLTRAMANHNTYRASDESWMLSRCILAASDLSNLTDAQVRGPSPMKFSVLGRKGADARALVANLEADLTAHIGPFLGRFGARASIDAMEFRVPEAVTTPDDAARLATHVADLLGGGIQAFFEVDIHDAPDAAARIDALIEGLSICHAQGNRVGFKLRTGGTTPAAIPSVERVASAIRSCWHHVLPMKFTAGLHHPVRRYDKEIGADTHGFLNVFGAAVLADSGEVSEDEIRAILSERDPAAFLFEEAGFGWRGSRSVLARRSPEQIEDARRFALSFGSCSFEEPVEDLRDLGLLAAV